MQQKLWQRLPATVLVTAIAAAHHTAPYMYAGLSSRQSDITIAHHHIMLKCWPVPAGLQSMDAASVRKASARCRATDTSDGHPAQCAAVPASNQHSSGHAASQGMLMSAHLMFFRIFTELVEPMPCTHADKYNTGWQLQLHTG